MLQLRTTKKFLCEVLSARTRKSFYRIRSHEASTAVEQETSDGARVNSASTDDALIAKYSMTDVPYVGPISSRSGIRPFLANPALTVFGRIWKICKTAMDADSAAIITGLITILEKPLQCTLTF